MAPHGLLPRHTGEDRGGGELQQRHPRISDHGIGSLSCPSEETAGEKIVRAGNVVLRLQPSLLEEARKLAEAEGVTLNQLIDVAVAEKVSALRTAACIAERAGRADLGKALGILKRAGVGRPPMKGDELPQSKRRRRVRPA